jgi:oxepin-CoA hydrolase/3-oxo-5,6-dehydrosuberyl-CoA semialdehyde dehydrogenase
VARLLSEAKPVFGNPERVEVAGADPERGAFLSPLLLRCDDLSATAPHEVEAFGPVSTLLSYGDLDEVTDAAARGGGSLVGSIVTADPQVARTLVTALAPWHGRLLVLNQGNAAESTGHGVAMPQMQHGGPGRAGGGAELGGLRALHHYLQRTAVQGDPEFLAGLA